MLPRLSDDFCRHQREMSGPLAPTQSGRLWPCVPPRAFELHGDEVGGARTIAAELRHSGSSDQAFPIGRAGAIARSASSSPGAQRPWLASSRAISTRMCATTCVLLPTPKPFQRSCREREKVAVRFALRLLKLDRLRHRGLSGGKDEVQLTATTQNWRRPAKLICRCPPQACECAAQASSIGVTAFKLRDPRRAVDFRPDHCKDLLAKKRSEFCNTFHPFPDVALERTAPDAYQLASCHSPSKRWPAMRV